MQSEVWGSNIPLKNADVYLNTVRCLPNKKSDILESPKNLLKILKKKRNVRSFSKIFLLKT